MTFGLCHRPGHVLFNPLHPWKLSKFLHVSRNKVFSSNNNKSFKFTESSWMRSLAFHFCFTPKSTFLFIFLATSPYDSKDLWRAGVRPAGLRLQADNLWVSLSILESDSPWPASGRGWGSRRTWDLGDSTGSSGEGYLQDSWGQEMHISTGTAAAAQTSKSAKGLALILPYELPNQQ